VTSEGINLLSYSGLSYQYTNEARAVYSQLTYDFRTLADALSGLKVTAGGRYTWGEVHPDGGSFSLGPDGAPVACTNGVTVVTKTYSDCDQYESSHSATPSWTLGFDYPIESHVRTYGKVTRGYKRGGFNFSAANPIDLAYGPQYVTTYETGFKSTFRIPDIPVIFNAAAANKRGVDLEMRISPVKRIEISGNSEGRSGER
jgi:iron complex outermembrane receptor protein